MLLIHEGGFPTGDYNDCPGISGAIVDIVKKLDKAVDLVISGHTHKAYNCRIDGRLVTSGDKYGTIVSEIDIVLDPKTGKVTQARADNLIVRTDRFNKDPAQTQLITAYEQLAAPLAKRVVGRIAAPLTRDESPAGEMPVGQVVADAQLAATRAMADGGAQIALMNPGGLRANLTAAADGAVRYEDLFAVQPFYNNLVTLSLTGAQILQVLEQQWLNQARPRILQVSKGFAYTWDSAKPAGQRVVPGSVTLDGKPLEATATYRVTVNSFLADGGDGFRHLQAGPRAAHRRDGRRRFRTVHRSARTGRDHRARSHQAAQLSMLAPAEIIRTKRDGGALDEAQIGAFVQGLASSGHARWSEGQVAALAMAVLIKGMTRAECVTLTRAMTHSGTVLDWSRAGFDGPIVDKHSTGGVGDKVSLMLAPIVAACGGVVPMVSGRGLGHTGGTLDKMQSLAGYNVAPGRTLLTRVLRDAGCAIVGASARVAPADRRLYAIRDVTATVESVPLITASILSKKLAAGLGALVMDVKVGNGAFCQTMSQARALADSLLEVAAGAGLPTRALITDMNQVLGRNAGNALEVREAIDFLTGVAREPRLGAVTLALAAHMLVLAGLAQDLPDAERRAQAALDGGHAAERFARMVAALGGPKNLLSARFAGLSKAPVVVDVPAPASGFVCAMDTRAIGLAVIALGGGRLHASDTIDARVGFSQMRAIGMAVQRNDRLACVHARNRSDAIAARDRLLGALTIGDAAPSPTPVVLWSSATG